MESKIPLPSSQELLYEIPLPEDRSAIVKNGTEQIKKTLADTNHAEPMVLVIGPCSVDSEEAISEFAKRMAPVAEECRGEIIIVLRHYTQKPRTVTNEDNWNGIIYQPDIFKPINVAAGLRASRSSIVNTLKYGMASADEMLFLRHAGHFVDSLSWVAIGARNSESGDHRAHASDMDIPVGVKHPTSGSLKKGVNGVLSAQSRNAVIDESPYPHQRMSRGNPFAHLVMRGSDESGPNFSEAHLREATKLMQEAGIMNPSIIMDASHDQILDVSNKKKDPMKQIDVIRDNMKTLEKDRSIPLKGWMVESHLVGGSQKIPPRAFALTPEQQEGVKSKLIFGQSITDPCIPIDTINPFILEELLPWVREYRRKA